MEGNPDSSRKSDVGLASIPNVTIIVAVAFLLFAVITQVLAAIGTISLSPALQVRIWLAAGGLIVLLLIADMAWRAYTTSKTDRSGEILAAVRELRAAPVPEPNGQVRSGPPPASPPDGADTRPSDPLNAGNPGHDAPATRNGYRLPVEMAEVFPKGCYLVPESISETYDDDEKTKTRRPSIDKITSKRVYQCRVVDMDPDRKGWSRQTPVKIVADQMPVPPTQVPYEPVEFEGLTAIPHATDGGRVAYSRLCATGIKQAIPAGREHNGDAAHSGAGGAGTVGPG